MRQYKYINDVSMMFMDVGICFVGSLCQIVSDLFCVFNRQVKCDYDMCVFIHVQMYACVAFIYTPLLVIELCIER